MRTSNGYYVQDIAGASGNPPVTTTEGLAAKNVTWDGTYIKFDTNYLVYANDVLKIASYTTPPTILGAKWTMVV
jgi:hypothetical protein